MDEDDSFEEDFEGAYLQADAGKKCTVYLVDGSPKMFEIPEDDDQETDCAFRRALKATFDEIFIVKLQMINKAVTSKEEYTACIFINTVRLLKEEVYKASKLQNIDNVFVWQDVGVINAERVQQVEELLKLDDIRGKFENMCGGHGKADYGEILFLCIRKVKSEKFNGIFTFSPKFQKRVVYLLTNEDDPFGKNVQHKSGAVKNAQDLRSHGAEFAIFPLLTESEEFQFKFHILKELDPNVEKNCENVSELEKDVPRKQYARRNISSVPLILGENVKLAVGVYSLMHAEKLPSAIPLDAEENAPVQRSFIYTNKKYFFLSVFTEKYYSTNQTDEEVPLLNDEIKRVKDIGGVQVSMSAQEIDKVRKLSLPGLLLLGFKPLSCLKLSHHVRSSQYLFPLEMDTSGSTRLYRALWEGCLKLKMMAVCRYTQKENTPPKLVLLVPQAFAEQEDEAKITNKFRYPGFHLIYLPFFEDKRDLTDQMTNADGEWPKADNDQINAARNFIKKLSTSYHPEKFSNPVLQKHYKVVEAMALNYEDVPEISDQTEPYYKREEYRKRVEKELQEFCSLTLPDGYSAEKKKVTKLRKATDAEDEFLAKRKKVDTSEKSLEDLANNQQLNSLTVAELKAKAAEVNIPYTSKTKKSDLITIIEAHYGITSKSVGCISGLNDYIGSIVIWQTIEDRVWLNDRLLVLLPELYAIQEKQIPSRGTYNASQVHTPFLHIAPGTHKDVSEQVSPTFFVYDFEWDS
ncbi:unnamed protein product [Enterobius vermicularis]|uniref:ATP-dependent DNA helicase 2 subunit 1 n=1 Tax=Enterobius vermicularis TaxID=51028 RepID=A0A158Q938_ENTVE|nr:unnamed protein product [Enterobius vermicularis]